MKRIGVVGVAFAFLLLYGIATTGYAQHDDRRDQNKPHDQHQAQPQHHDQHQAQPQHNNEHHGQAEHHAGPPDRHPERRGDHYAEGPHHMEPGHDRGGWQQHRAGHFESEHRSWRDRGGYRGYHVPDDHFRRSFGRGHGFRIHGLPYMEVGGYPRFQYGGLWFSVIEPYPEYWGDDWYDRDEMYVDYFDGGYYLFNRRFPGRPGVAVMISR